MGGDNGRGEPTRMISPSGVTRPEVPYRGVPGREPIASGDVERGASCPCSRTLLDTALLPAPKSSRPPCLAGNTPVALLVPTGLPSPGTRFPISSPFRCAPALAPGGGGTPIPKEPRGTGVPPFFSNFEILSRKVATEGLVGLGPVPLAAGGGETTRSGRMGGGARGSPLAAPSLPWLSAAMRSLRLTGGLVALEEVALWCCQILEAVGD
jgi:hypothetical protein